MAARARLFEGERPANKDYGKEAANLNASRATSMRTRARERASDCERRLK